MAPELKSKKRKSAEMPAPAASSKKLRADKPSKTPQIEKPSKKAKSADVTAPDGDAPLAPAKSTKSSRKRAADFFEDGEPNSATAPVEAAGKKAKKPKKTAEPVEQVAAPEEAAPESKPAKSKKSKGAAQPAENAVVEEAVAAPKDKKSKGAKALKEAADAEALNQLTPVKPGEDKKKKVRKGREPVEGVAITGTKVEEPAETAQEGKTAGKRGKKSKEAVGEAVVEEVVVAVPPKKAVKKTKKAKEAEEEPVAEEVGDDEDDEDIDDQTAALLKGFESSDEEGAPDGEAVAVDEVPAIPTDKKLRKKLDKAAAEDGDGPGVIYVGRIPHGFYEHQMRSYFSQFGEVTKLRLSRNKKTGRSRHFAFIEFAHSSVAKIVADTMDKYLLFGHILQVRTIPKEQVHEALFKGAGRRFKKVPANKIEGRSLRLGTDREGWEKRNKKEEARRKDKAEKLKGLGYEFEAPALRSAGDMPMKDADEAGAEKIEGATNGLAQKALTEKPHEEDEEITEVLRIAQTKPGKTVSTGKVKVKVKKAEKDAAAPAVEEAKVKKPSKDSSKPSKVKKAKAAAA
ncbi:nucleolar protein [Coniosporium apollinis]|uniref:Nucleolar protein n=1 Tax=Coniosporium apollinis TaxID=61459 RepID=A0ABQ9NPI5_9PEZI|nr:nucleolar protein [Coniosporium apollinis]